MPALCRCSTCLVLWSGDLVRCLLGICLHGLICGDWGNMKSKSFQSQAASEPMWHFPKSPSNKHDATSLSLPSAKLSTVRHQAPERGPSPQGGNSIPYRSGVHHPSQNSLLNTMFHHVSNHSPNKWSEMRWLLRSTAIWWALILTTPSISQLLWSHSVPRIIAMYGGAKPVRSRELSRLVWRKWYGPAHNVVISLVEVWW